MKKPYLRKVSLMLGDDYHQVHLIERIAEIRINYDLDGTHLTTPEHKIQEMLPAIQDQYGDDENKLHLVQVLMAYQPSMSNLPSVYDVELVEECAVCGNPHERGQAA